MRLDELLAPLLDHPYQLIKLMAGDGAREEAEPDVLESVEHVVAVGQPARGRARCIGDLLQRQQRFHRG